MVLVYFCGVHLLWDSMKKFLAVFFSSLYILAMVRPVAPLFDYIINQDYIAEFLCINQDKPEMQCNGKCQMMMQIEKQQEEKRQNLPAIAMEEYPIGFVEFLTLKRIISLTPKTETVTCYINNYSFKYSYSDFHPPCPLG